MTLDRPALKVLLMSGFTGGMLVLNEGWHFLKPFITSQLLTLVSGCLAGAAFKVRKPRPPRIFLYWDCDCHRIRQNITDTEGHR